MSARRSISMGLVWLCAAAGALVWCSTPALAQRMHAFSFSFGSEGTGPGQFSRPGALAVNDVTGDVYVIDQGNPRVEVFSATGTFISEFNGSASPTGVFSWPEDGKEVLYVHARGQTAVDNSENPLDPSAGDIYVFDEGHHVVDKFSATGAYINQIVLPILGGLHGWPKSIAVDASGTLWVEEGGEFSGSITPGSEEQLRFAEFNDAVANEPVGEVFPTVPPRGGKISGGEGNISMAVDPEGNIYVGLCPHFTVCENYPSFRENSESEFVGLQVPAEFSGRGGGQLITNELDEEETTGLAVDNASGDVYVDNATSIAAFGPKGVPIERFGSTQLTDGQVEVEYSPQEVEDRWVASEGIAVNSSTGAVYASDAATQSVDAFSAFVVPDVSAGSASEFGETSVTVNGVVNPDGPPVKSCVFEYGTTTSYGHEAPCTANPGSGDAPVAVSANLSGLERLTRYHFRLKVSNANGSNVGQDRTFATSEPVGISEEAVFDVSSTSALFSALVDPGDSETMFRFEYGPSVAYGESVPVPDGELGAGVSAVPVSVRPEDLVAGATYHVRLVASNALGTVYGPDEMFTTQAPGGAFALPDGRVWEMVSPPAKDGAGIEPLEYGLVEAAEDGSAISYLASSSIVPNPAGNPAPGLRVQLLSRRGAGGWSTEEIALPRPRATGSEVTSEYRLFTSDLSSALVEPLSEQFDRLSPEATEPTPYLRDDNTGTYLPLVTAGDVEPPGTEFSSPNRAEKVYVLTATPDLSHVLLSSPLALTENAVRTPEGAGPGAYNVYEWAPGHLKLVDVLPDGTTPGVGVVGFLNGNIEGDGDVRRTISDDGSKVFWKERVSEEKSDPLYMRDTVTEQTVQVDAPAPGVPSPPAFRSRFQIASADGSRVFFTEEEPLTVNSKLPPVDIGERSTGVEDLYVYNTTSGTLTDLSGGGGASGSEPGNVQGEVLGASEDGSIVYFVATAKLAEGAQAGQDNLYVTSETGSGWSTRLVAVLSGEDGPDWAGGTELTSRVSPNGRFLAFMSDRSLTGYDNRDVLSGAPDEEVFLYDDATGHLVCASCNPTGERPSGIFDERYNEQERGKRLLDDRPEWWGAHWLAAMIPGWTGVRGTEFGPIELGEMVPYQQRYLSNEGRLFFNGFDSLTAQATNGKANVYEYEPEGVGSCAGSTGCLGLISSGTSSEESAFMDASENGDDVFFLTASRLVPPDVDTSMDVYDAHVCSAIAPCVSAVVSPPPCSSGDACKAAPSLQPAIFGAPSSATFSGVGNIARAEGVGSVKAPKRSSKKKSARGKRGRKPKKTGKGRVRRGKSARARRSLSAGTRR